MKTLLEIGVYDKLLLYVSIMTGIFLSLILFMNHKQEKRYFPYMILEGLFLVISYVEFNLLVVAMDYVFDGKVISGWRVGLIHIPVMIHLILQFGIVCIEVFLCIEDFKWRRNHLSINSIKEGMDSMPYGICCYYKTGMPRLINKEMQQIAEELFGERISNASSFWEQINKEYSTKRAKRIEEYTSPTWVIDDCRVFSFVREKINYENGFLYEILATNITEEYEKTKKLSYENERMRVVTNRLKEYSRNVTRLTIEKEVLDAKIRVHSELGQTLVATRRYFTTQDIDEKELLAMWNKNIKLLKKEGNNPDEDDYEILYTNARQLGILLKMSDDLPLDEEFKEIIITAGMECLTNTYKYADSKLLNIDVVENSKNYTVYLSNPEDVSTKEIKETGGLRNLRKIIETKGGLMKLSSEPYFCLSITMEKR